MELSTEKQPITDLYRTEAFRYAVRPVHEYRMRRLLPEQRQAVKHENAILIGLNGLVSMVNDLRRRRHPSDTRRTPQPYWSRAAHGWVFR